MDKAGDMSTAHISAGSARRGAVIFDRDGVLNADVAYAHRPDQIRWVEGAAAAVRAVNAAGLFAFVATNQSGIARGLYTEADVVALHDWMNGELAGFGAHIDAFVYSPYHPDGVVEAYRRASPCRKPGPGMILDLLARFPVDPKRVLMIGDQPTDVEAAHAAGVTGLLFNGGSVLAAITPWLNDLADSPEAQPRR
jgi:D-glycero-D-manno-heptose 1,7-bisphosphate phosphatase